MGTNKNGLSRPIHLCVGALPSLQGYIAEAFVFSYFGVASCTYLASAKYFSPMLILTYTGLIPLVRAVVVSLLFGLSMMLRCNMRLPVLRKEVLLVILGGMMRGGWVGGSVK